jgi:hypothetical protein
VIQQPIGITDPMVVRFKKSSPMRCLLDQCARWTPDGWDQSRWVPASPAVPKFILSKVEGKLNG